MARSKTPAQWRGLIFAILVSALMAAIGMWAMGWLDRDVQVVSKSVISGVREYLGINKSTPSAPPPMDIFKGARRKVEPSVSASVEVHPTDRVTQAHRQRGAIVGYVRVVDADTLQMDGTTIRLWGIDAPESNQVCDGLHRRWRCGDAATEAVQDYVRDLQVACYDKGVDVYGRTLGQCFVGHIDLNGWVVENGWAFAYRHYTRSYASRESTAKFRQRGVWVVSDPVRPWDWRRQHRAQ